jgi:hypothetical protein
MEENIEKDEQSEKYKEAIEINKQYIKDIKEHNRKSEVEVFDPDVPVFASEKINAGDIIEEAPFLVLESTNKINKDVKLSLYAFSYIFHDEDFKKKIFNLLLMLWHFTQ